MEPHGCRCVLNAVTQSICKRMTTWMSTGMMDQLMKTDDITRRSKDWHLRRSSSSSAAARERQRQTQIQRETETERETIRGSAEGEIVD